jgi:hypothetical protein
MLMVASDWEPSIPEVLLPEQFADIWNERGRGPGEGLAYAVLEQAIRDLRRARYARKRREQRIYMDAYNWIRSDAREHVFSFVNICEVLGLSVDALRDELLGLRAKARGADLAQAA